MGYKSTQSVTLEHALEIAVQTLFYEAQEAIIEAAKQNIRRKIVRRMENMSPAEVENWLEDITNDNRNFIVVDDTGRPMASIHRG
jgi:hypothetical protein